MSLAKLVIGLSVPAPKIESFNNYLFIGPHPDDIEIGAGAAIAKLTSQGKRVTFLICTDGRFGDGSSNGVKGDDLVCLRKEEAIKSASVLGVKDVRFLGLQDGNGYEYSEMLKGMAKVVGEVKPEIIFAPDAGSRSECHIDHLNTGNAAKQIACFSSFEGIMKANYEADAADVQALAFYMTSRPNRFIRTGSYKKLQFKALFGCHLSQYPASSEEASALKLYLNIRSLQYGLRKCALNAEGFRVYSKTLMHCLPEAD